MTGNPAETVPARRTDAGAWLIALVTFGAYTVISVSRYLRLDPGSWDLGIFTEYVKQIAHLSAPVVDIRGAGFNLLGDHFQPIVALIAPFFRLFPTPVTLLVAQALLTAVSVVPVCAAARATLGIWPSRAIGAAYGFSWGLQQMINFDFHEIAFAVPLLAFSLSALIRRRLWPAVAWALPLVLVKEDQGFTLAAAGLVIAGAAWTARKWPRPWGLVPAGDATRWAWAGVLLAAWGLAWSWAEIAVIIPHFNPSHTYPYWSMGGTVSPGGHVSAATVWHQFTASGREKLQTTFLIVAPVAFLALGSPLALVAVPSIVLRFVSTNSYFWGTAWHYNATVMPIVFLAGIDTLARLRARAAARAAERNPADEDAADPDSADPPRRRTREPAAVLTACAAGAMLVIAGWFAFRFPLASLWSAQTYESSSHIEAGEAAIAKVPPGTTVESTLPTLASLAARDQTFWVGSSGDRSPHYVVFDELESGYSPPPTNVGAFVNSQHPGSSYTQIYCVNGVYVFRLSSYVTGHTTG